VPFHQRRREDFEVVAALQSRGEAPLHYTNGAGCITTNLKRLVPKKVDVRVAVFLQVLQAKSLVPALEKANHKSQ
jgi:hypothetical protein